MANFQILTLPGDGIGPEVTDAAKKVLATISSHWGHTFTYSEDLVGGAAIDTYGLPLRLETTLAAQESDAVLFGAVGGPKWDDAPVRPEAAILGLRKAMGLFANLRPVKVLPGLEDSSPLKKERVVGADVLIVRELTGGLYFGKPKARWTTKQGQRGVDTLRYTEQEIDRILRVGFELARIRRQKLTSVDKANVLETGRLWRSIATRVSRDYPDVKMEHALVDSCAMQIINTPTAFDVIVTENMFGDILSDEVAVLTASLGMLPSASLASLPQTELGESRSRVKGLYEPVHGSAPDIAGRGKANPIGSILSAAFMLQYSFGLDKEASAIQRAVEGAITSGLRTPDIATNQDSSLTTLQMTEAICDRVAPD